MNVDVINGVMSIRLNAMMTLALGCLLWLFSVKVRSALPTLKKYCIPAPVIGGFSSTGPRRERVAVAAPGLFRSECEADAVAARPVKIRSFPFRRQRRIEGRPAGIRAR